MKRLDADDLDWRLPWRVLRLARRVGVTPWEALAWLESVLTDFDTQASVHDTACLHDSPGLDGLPWPPVD